MNPYYSDDPIDFNDYIAASTIQTSTNTVYRNTAKADPAIESGNYQENSRNLKPPRSKPGASSVITRPPKPVI